MHRSEKSRHPFFENVVFGLALLLVAILVFYGARSFLGRRSQVPPPQAGGLSVAARPDQAAPAGSATESAVTSVPPLRLSHAGSARNWRTEVPSPTGAKDK
jgi:hypothetical protein